MASTCVSHEKFVSSVTPRERIGRELLRMKLLATYLCFSRCLSLPQTNRCSDINRTNFVCLSGCLDLLQDRLFVHLRISDIIVLTLWIVPPDGWQLVMLCVSPCLSGDIHISDVDDDDEEFEGRYDRKQNIRDANDLQQSLRQRLVTSRSVFFTSVICVQAKNVNHTHLMFFSHHWYMHSILSCVPENWQGRLSFSVLSNFMSVCLITVSC